MTGNLYLVNLLRGLKRRSSYYGTATLPSEGLTMILKRGRGLEATQRN